MNGSDITDEVAGLLAGMINDPEEAMWGQYNAMKALALVRPELIEPHVDRLLHFLKSDCWWMSEGAMTALARIAGDRKHYSEILPAVAEVMTGDTHVSRISRAGALFSGLKNAAPEVKKLAVEVLAKAYAEYPMPEQIHAPNKISMEGAAGYLVYLIGGYAVQFPGGADAIFEAAKKRYPNQTLPHSSLFTKAKGGPFSRALQKALEEFKQSGAKASRW